MAGSEFSNGLIWLDEPKSVYYPGQLITGKVNFELNNPLKLLYINVAFNGEANVEWLEEEYETYSGVKRRKEVKYVGREVYFDFTLCICGGQGVADLPTGAHSIPFLYQLPPNLPSTFKGDKGQISYKITATLLHQDGVTKENIVKKFDIVAPLDLNTEENKEPIQMEFEELFSCNWSCTSRPLYIAIRAPQSGYCPGQVIPFTVDARNESNVEVTKIIFEVTKRTRYLSQQPISSIIPPEELVVSMKKGPILSNTTRQYVFELKLPDFIALNLDNCGIIDTGYFLKVRMKLSGCNEDLTGESSLCLGLVPIGSTADVKVTHPMAECLPISPIPDTTRTQPSLNNEPPPYTSVFNQNYTNNVQICPPGPFPYPTVANVVDKSMYGSKNNIVGAFETHTQHEVTQNTAPIPGFQPYPYMPPGQNERSYPGYPQGPTSYPNEPQNQNSSYNGAQFPLLPPGQNYPLQPLSTLPSAPPP